jgi:RimJ/RimL family protein N-acetyltransferase
MLQGEKVILGPIVPNDFPALFRWGDDIDAARLNEPYRPPTWRNQEELWFNVGRDPSRVFFAIRKIGLEPIVGYVQITNIDGVHHSATLGMRIGEAGERGKGYGSDSLRLAVNYCWSHLNLSRIQLGVYGTNERAIRLYERMGFEVEGRLRKALFIDGQWIDFVLMALMRPVRY